LCHKSSTRSSSVLRGRHRINQSINGHEFFCGAAEGKKKSLHDGLPLIRRRSRIAIHVVTIPSPRGERFLQAEKRFRAKNSKASVNLPKQETWPSK
jgi:hypothetical protein